MHGCIGGLSRKTLRSEKLDVTPGTGKTSVQATGEYKGVSARGKNS